MLLKLLIILNKVKYIGDKYMLDFILYIVTYILIVAS